MSISVEVIRLTVTKNQGLLRSLSGNIREGERKPTRRRYYYFSRKEEMERLVSEYPISNELVDPEDGIVDENALNYVMEIGMLVKVYQAGLIDERMLAKIKDYVSKRYSTHYSFLE